jgi:penicillin-binding protein 1A
VGYTPYYVGAAWIGYDKNADNKNEQNTRARILGSTNYSARIWQIVMEKVHRGLENKDFLEPSGIVRQKICIDSGQLATDACSRDPRGDRTRVEMFIKGTEPTDYCKFHK